MKIYVRRITELCIERYGLGNLTIIINFELLVNAIIVIVIIIIYYAQTTLVIQLDMGDLGVLPQVIFQKLHFGSTTAP